MVERRIEVRPASPFRLPRLIGRDGVMRRRGDALRRLVHVGDDPVVVGIAQPAADRVAIAAAGPSAGACDEAIGRIRFALGVDDDLSEFHARFRDDPLIGPAIRRSPWVRPVRRPEPFEALAWAVTEQLIDYPRAAEIQRRIVRALGRRCPRTGLLDLPAAAVVAAQSPATLESFGLSAARSRALVRAAREIDRGRIDLRDPDHERGWRRLRAIPGIGSWTVDVLAHLGQGRHDIAPAGDLHLLELVGRLRSGGDPRVRATEEEVRAFFAPYAPWSGLAATYAISLPRGAGPRRAGTPWSSPRAGRAAA